MTKRFSANRLICYFMVLIMIFESLQLSDLGSIKVYANVNDEYTISLGGLEGAYFEDDIIFLNNTKQPVSLNKNAKGEYIYHAYDLPLSIANPIKYANEFNGWNEDGATEAKKDLIINLGDEKNYIFTADFEMNNVLIYYDDDVACQNYNGTPLTELKRTPNEILTKTGLGKSTLETPCELLARIFGWQGDINAQNPWVENNVTFTSDFNNIKWDDLIGNYTMIFICFPNDGIVDYADKLMQYANDGGCLTLVGETNGGWAYGNKVLNNLFKQMGVSLSVGNNVAQYGNTCKVLNPDHPLFEGVTTLEGGAVAAININGQKTKDNTTELLAMPSTDGKDYVIMTDTKIGNGYITLMCDIDMWAGSGTTWANNLDPAYSRGDSKAFIKKMDIRSKENIRRTKSMKSISYSGMEDASLGVDDENNPYANPNKYDENSFPISLYNPVKEGYTFVGWSGPGLDKCVINAVINKDQIVKTGTPLSELIYTANWKKEESISVLIKDWTYMEEPSQVLVTGYRDGANIESIKYYCDAKCTKMTNTAEGANAEGEIPSKIGTYYVKVTIGGDDNYLESYGVTQFKIKPIELNEDMFSIKSGELKKDLDEDFLLIDYDGKEHSIDYEINYPANWKYGELKINTDYSILDNPTSATDKGDYEVVFQGIGNYSGRIVKKWKIDYLKKIQNIYFENIECCPDKKPHSLNITGVPSGAEILYGLKDGVYDLKDNPEFLDGTHTVYFKISKKHYEDYCGYADIILEHNFSENFTVDKKETCDEDGSKSKHCLVDGCNEKTDITVIPKLKHDYESSITKYPTCTDEGTREYVCKHDKSHNYKENVPALGHDWEQEWTVIKEPTDKEEGRAEKKCKRDNCGERLVKILPALSDGNNSQPKFIIEAELEKDVPADFVILNNTEDEIINSSKIFTDEEREKVINNIDARVWLQVSKSDINTTFEKDEKLIEDYVVNNLKEVGGIEYFDVSLLKKIGSDKAISISEPGIDISFSVKLSRELINDDATKVREYYVVRLHNNQVTFVKSEFNKKTDELKIESDGFSIFAVCYIDKVAGLPLVESGYADISLNKDKFEYTGKDIFPKVVVTYTKQKYDKKGNLNGKRIEKVLKENVDYALTFENNINAGTGKVICKGIGDFSFVIEKKFEITKKDASKWKTVNKEISILYDGSDKTETISNNIIVMDKKSVVSKDNYSINITGDTVNPGKVKVVISVKESGNYKGKCPKAFININIVSGAEYDLTTADITFKEHKGDYVYNGNAVRPKIDVSVNGKTIKKNNYTVFYKNNINAGEASVYVVGKGKATGISKSAIFIIKPQDISKVKHLKNQKIDWRKSLSNINPKLRYGKNYLVKNRDYVMEVEDISTAEFKEKLMNSKNVPVDIIIRPSEQNTNFVDSSADKSGLKIRIYVTKRNLRKKFVTNVEGYSYINEKGKIVPDFDLYYLNEKLVPNVDYKYSIHFYYKPDNPNKLARAKIRGLGMYKGSLDVIWVVARKY